MVTIRDIAKKAGVSASTASRALNKNPHISQATIQKVQSIADKLGYMPDYNAKNLTTGEASAVGVVFPVGGNGTPGNPFFVNILTGINKELIKRGYALSVAITQTSDDLMKNVKSMLYQSKIKRFILLYSQKDDPVAQFLQDNDLRYVVIGQPINNDDFYVDNDNIEVGKVATQFLIENYHIDHLAFVHSAANWLFEQQRFAGFKQAADKKKVPYHTFSYDANNAAAFKETLREHPEINGVVATDDLNAMNFYDAFKNIFPEQKIELIGINNSLPQILFEHNFHSIDLFPAEMGKKATNLLFSDRENQNINDAKHLQVGYQIK